MGIYCDQEMSVITFSRRKRMERVAGWESMEGRQRREPVVRTSREIVGWDILTMIDDV
jgi:hypothetical protein